MLSDLPEPYPANRQTFPGYHRVVKGLLAARGGPSTPVRLYVCRTDSVEAAGRFSFRGAVVCASEALLGCFAESTLRVVLAHELAHTSNSKEGAP